MEYGEEEKRLTRENSLEAAERLLWIAKRSEDYQQMREAAKMAARIFLKELQPHLSYLPEFRRAMQNTGVIPTGVSYCLAVLMANWGNDRNPTLNSEGGLEDGVYPIQLNLALYLNVLHVDLNLGPDIFPGMNFPGNFREIYEEFQKDDGEDRDRVGDWYGR